MEQRYLGAMLGHWESRWQREITKAAQCRASKACRYGHCCYYQTLLQAEAKLCIWRQVPLTSFWLHHAKLKTASWLQSWGQGAELLHKGNTDTNQMEPRERNLCKYKPYVATCICYSTAISAVHIEALLQILSSSGRANCDKKEQELCSI